MNRTAAARFSALGDKPFVDFLAVYKRTATRDGPESLEDDQGPEPKVLAAFRNVGPEAHEKAVKANSRFDELVAAGYTNDTDQKRKRFVENELRTAGVRIAV